MRKPGVEAHVLVQSVRMRVPLHALHRPCHAAPLCATFNSCFLGPCSSEGLHHLQHWWSPSPAVSFYASPPSKTWQLSHTWGAVAVAHPLCRAQCHGQRRQLPPPTHPTHMHMLCPAQQRQQLALCAAPCLARQARRAPLHPVVGCEATHMRKWLLRACPRPTACARAHPRSTSAWSSARS